VDGRAVMRIICQDTKLNIAPTYLKPGFAFGGSCLPKDLRAVASESRRRALNLPVLEAILNSNQAYLESCIRTVLETGCRKIGMLGLTFKEDTDDLRESPAVELAERLLGKGCKLMIYEPAITPGSIYGTNLQYIQRTIPHIWELLAMECDSVVRDCDLIIILKKISAIERKALENLHQDQICIDFVGSLGEHHAMPADRYITFAGPKSSAKAAGAGY